MNEKKTIKLYGDLKPFTGRFSTMQDAIDWARDRGADRVTVIESLSGAAKRVVFSGRPG